MNGIRLLAVGLVFFTQIASANQIYKSVDSKGVPTYSDTPTSTSQQVEVQPIQGYTSPKAEGPSETNGSSVETNASSVKQPADNQAQSISISSPTQEMMVHTNEGKMTATVVLGQPLTPEQQIVMMVDGQATGNPQTDTTFQVEGLTPGKHSLQAKIIQGQNEVSVSDTVIFYVWRASLDRPRSAAPIRPIAP